MRFDIAAFGWLQEFSKIISFDLSWMARYFRKPLIGVKDFQRIVEYDDPILGIFNDGSVSLFTFSQCFFGLDAFADIPGDV